MEAHPYTKFIHSENQDILWGLFKNTKFAERPQTDQSSESETEFKSFFKREIRNYYTSQIVSSGKPCSSVRELFEINRDALAHLFSTYSAFSPSVSTYEIPIGGINVIEEKKTTTRKATRPVRQFFDGIPSNARSPCAENRRDNDPTVQCTERRKNQKHGRVVGATNAIAQGGRTANCGLNETSF